MRSEAVRDGGHGPGDVLAMPSVDAGLITGGRRGFLGSKAARPFGLYITDSRTEDQKGGIAVYTLTRAPSPSSAAAVGQVAGSWSGRW
jgi:hypothetical protein